MTDKVTLQSTLALNCCVTNSIPVTMQRNVHEFFMTQTKMYTWVIYPTEARFEIVRQLIPNVGKLYCELKYPCFLKTSFFTTHVCKLSELFFTSFTNDKEIVHPAKWHWYSFHFALPCNRISYITETYETSLNEYQVAA